MSHPHAGGNPDAFGPPHSLYYVYGFIWAPDPIDAGMLPSMGVSGAPVSPLVYRDLAAIVSPVPVEDFGPGALPAKLQDAAWVAANALAHHRVLDWLLGHCSVLPLRFGTLCRGAERVEEMVACHCRQLDDALSRVDGASEWDVKLYCHREALMGYLARTQPQVHRMVEAAAAASEGAVFFLRKRAERHAREEADALVAAHSEDVQQRLAPLARAAVASDRRPWETDSGSAELIFHNAYLVANDDREAFRAAVAALRERSEPMGFTLVLSGPWPAYSFVQLVLEDPA